MRKVNVFGLKKPRKEILRYTVVDKESQPDIEGLDFLFLFDYYETSTAISNYSLTYTEMYLQDKYPLPSIDGEMLTLNKTSLMMACTVLGFQHPETEDWIPYTFEEIVGLLNTFPKGMAELLYHLSMKLNNNNEDILPPTPADWMPL